MNKSPFKEFSDELKKTRRFSDRADESSEFKKWEDNNNKEKLKMFVGRGWVDHALELLEQLGDAGWGLKIDDRSNSDGMNLLDVWSQATNNPNDAKFLEKWMEYEKRVGHPKDNYKDFLAKDKHRQGKDYSNSVSYAARSLNWEKVEMLLGVGKDWGSSHIYWVDSALSSPNNEEIKAIVKFLLKLPHAKEWINTSIKYKTSLLEMALLKGNDELVKDCLDAGADINALVDGETILHHIMGPSGPTAYKALVKKVMKMGGSLLVKNDSGETPVNKWVARHNADKWRYKGKDASWNKDKVEYESEWLKLQAIELTGKKKSTNNKVGAL